MSRWRRRDSEPRQRGPIAWVAVMGSLFAAVIFSAVGWAATEAPAHAGHASWKESAQLVGYGSSSADRMVALGTGVPALAAGSFSIAGSVGGLFPGRTLPLVLTVTNPLKVAITVTSISAAVSDASSACSAGNIKVTLFAGQLVVKAGMTAQATVEVTMLHAAPNACQGARFPFRYTGVGAEVHQ
jgi:hypothetical protein